MRACIAAVVGAVALVGCFTTAADFRDEAESFIVEDPSIAEGLGVAIASATCDEPVNQDVGTTFACTATDEAGDTWGFDVEIEESDRIGVSVTERP
jgi:hypothetical protein